MKTGIFKNNFTIFLIFLTVFLGALYYAIVGPHMDFNGLIVEQIALNILKGKGFSVSVDSPGLEGKLPPYSFIETYGLEGKPTATKDPLYPYFAAILYSIFGYNHWIICLTLIVLYALTVGILYKVTREAFNNKVAALACILIAVNPALISYANSPGSAEVLTLLFLVLLFLFLQKTINKKRTRYYILSGIMLGLGTLASGYLVLYFIPVIVVFFMLKRKEQMKKVVISSFAFILSFFLAISIWAGRNYFLLGTFSLRSDTGFFVLAKGTQCENRQRLAELTKGTVFIFSRKLGEFIWPDYKIDYNKIMCYEEDILMPRRAMMMKEGLNPFQVDRIYLREGIGKITRHPFKFLYI